MTIVFRFCALAFAIASGCATVAPSPVLPAIGVMAANRVVLDARAIAARAPYTVFFFYAAHCPCVAAHDGRIRELYNEFHQQGVQFIGIDSEISASPEASADEARKHGYDFPILIDRGAPLANALGAEYATFTVVVDRRGLVYYRGGIDSDRTHLRADSTLYVRDALRALIAGRTPSIVSGEALGCALQTW